MTRLLLYRHHRGDRRRSVNLQPQQTPTVAPNEDQSALVSLNAQYGALMSQMGAISNGNYAGVPPGDIGYAGLLGNDRYEQFLATASRMILQLSVELQSLRSALVMSSLAVDQIPTFGSVNAPILAITSTYS